MRSVRIVITARSGSAAADFATITYDVESCERGAGFAANAVRPFNDPISGTANVVLPLKVGTTGTAYTDGTEWRYFFDATEAPHFKDCP